MSPVYAPVGVTIAGFDFTYSIRVLQVGKVSKWFPSHFGLHDVRTPLQRMGSRSYLTIGPASPGNSTGSSTKLLKYQIAKGQEQERP
jgi:hypothetical protein